MATQTPLFQNYFLDCQMTPADGVAQCNHPIHLAFRLLKEGKPVTEGMTLRCITKWEHEECATRDFPVNGPTPMTMDYCSDRPGWVYFGFQLLDASGEVVHFPGTQVKQFTKKELFLFEIGALFDPEKIIAKPSCPEDFDAFWDAEVKRLDALPYSAKMTPIAPPAEYAGKLKLFALELNCLGHYPVTGYVAWPADAKERELTGCLDLLSMVWQDAPLAATCKEAYDNHALEMYLSWHGQPTGHPDSWYDQHQNDYYQPYQDMDDPVRWSMHDMFLRALRGLHFLKTLPLWNGKELVVRGGSLAGIETIALAALDKDIDVSIIDVPTGCEFNAMDSGRGVTWMFLFTGRKEFLKVPAVAKALAYHDAVNFAHRITCETYVCTGLADEVCFPSNVCSFYNKLDNASLKRLVLSPTNGHYGTTVNTVGDSRLAKVFQRVHVSENAHK